MTKSKSLKKKPEVIIFRKAEEPAAPLPPEGVWSEEKGIEAGPEIWYFRVNLKYPTKILLNAFDQWVRKKRKELGIPAP